MSNRLRDKKGTLISSNELQARRRALLAPVQKFRRAWVQILPGSSYKVLKWVPRDKQIGKNFKLKNENYFVYLDSFFDELNEIDTSSINDENENDLDNEDNQDNEENNEDSDIQYFNNSNLVKLNSELIDDIDSNNNNNNNLKLSKEINLDKWNSNVVMNTDIVGGELAGLDTGLNTDQVVIEEEKEEEEESPEPSDEHDQAQFHLLPTDSLLATNKSSSFLNLEISPILPQNAKVGDLGMNPDTDDEVHELAKQKDHQLTEQVI